MATINDYRPSDFGKKEEELYMKFRLQLEDAKVYFTTYIKPRLDRSYKLYIAYNGDRSRQIKSWQANITVPYIQAVVETLKPRILDARPDFTIQGRNDDDQMKARKIQQLADYTWEIAKMDVTSENVVSSALIYGTGYMQVGWRKDVRRHKFLKTKDLLKKKYEWVEKDQVFYDAPFCEWVDNYSLWYDWHNIDAKSKQYWFKRLVLTENEIRRRYPYADKKRLDMVMNRPGGDLIDYSWIRQQTKYTHSEIVKGADYLTVAAAGPIDRSIFMSALDSKLKMYEVFEWWRPFDDEFAVMVNYIPILKGGSIPIPYDFKESPFIAVPYLKMPNEFEGYGIPMLLENPQIMLNMIKNQRLDAMTLSIHKMWVVNPLANINKEELVTRPFGIIYSTDPNGVREIEFSDIKQSAYREEELLKSDMRYSSGVDDFSMGAGSQGGTSATEVRHLRESTLERVRLFINHLGEGYSDVLRYWVSMYRQFFTEQMTIRVIGDDGKEAFPLIEKDDLIGTFDFKASVIPSIAGQNDVKKKQDMDLFQLLINMPFIDPQKLTSKVLLDFNWDLESVLKGAEAQQPPIGPDGQPMQVGPDGQPLPPGGAGMDPSMMDSSMMGGQSPISGPDAAIPANIRDELLALLNGSQETGASAPSPFSEASMPIDLLQAGGPPPTVNGVPPTSNPRGFNRGGKVNTNVSMKAPNGPEAQINQQASNIQK